MIPSPVVITELHGFDQRSKNVIYRSMVRSRDIARFARNNGGSESEDEIVNPAIDVEGLLEDRDIC